MDKSDQLFSQLLYLLHHSAMQELGKISKPVNSQVNINLDQAQQLLHMLEMLKEKTNGNLSSELEKTQDLMLEELRLNFNQERVNQEVDGATKE